MGPPFRGVIFPLAADGSSTTSLSQGAGSRSQLQPLPLGMLQTTAGCRWINRRAVSLDEFTATASIHLH